MKTHLECIPCFLKQSLEATRMITDNEEIQTNVLNEVMKYLQNAQLQNSPPMLSKEVHKIIKNITFSKDPYITEKNKSNNLIKNKYNYLKKLITESDDPLLMSIKLSIIGNVIDYGSIKRFNIDEMIEKGIKQNLDVESYEYFNKELEKSKTILYLADNTGEIFFDKLLIEELKKRKKQITYVVKANPIINDALIADAKYAGIDKIAEIIEGDNGQKFSSPGIILDYASKIFLSLFEKSDMVISKGQGNYEGLSNTYREVFFMLVVKCPLVAQDINDKVGKLILKVK
jgi:uncharacterized protein with ATP-grasp and redox domains